MTQRSLLASSSSQLSILIGMLGVCMMLTTAFSAFILKFSNTTATLKMLQAVSTVSIFLVPSFAYALIMKRKHPFQVLGLVPAEKSFMYLLGVISITLALPVAILLGDINQLIPLPHWMVNLENDTSKQIAGFLKDSGIVALCINIIVMALLPAIGEEVFFRGALQPLMVRITKNATTGIIITAIFFAAMHFQFLGLLPRIFLGIMLGAMYHYGGSLWIVILAHFIYNGIQVVMVSFGINPSLPVPVTIICLIVVIGLMYIMKTKRLVA